MNESFFNCLVRLARLQNESVDHLALKEALSAMTDKQLQSPQHQVLAVVEMLHLPAPTFLRNPDPSNMPAVMADAQGSWSLVKGQNAQGLWVLDVWDEQTSTWLEELTSDLLGQCLVKLVLTAPFSRHNSPVYQLVRSEVLLQKKSLFEALLGGVLINCIALMTAFYTMQVYDRVVPTGATQTLLVLTMGIGIAIVFDFITKHLRANINEQIIHRVDQRLARTVYMRFLAVRLDQMPQSVGALSGQLRGYETVRSFLTLVTTHIMVDAPFALIFVAIVYAIGGGIAFIPLSFFVVSVLLGLYFKAQVDSLAGKANVASNIKTGLLVETVEGAETIKSGQGGWRMLSRWMNTSDEARSYELSMRRISDNAQHIVGSFQQLSYVGLVATGALLVTQSNLTMGGLIACSILSGRILAPVAAIPNILQQSAHSKAALKGLDAIWKLEDDHSGVSHPLVPEHVYGRYQFEKVEVNHKDKRALYIPALSISAGEKIGILGPVGSGKTTLLRLLSGMYKPNAGRILLDDMELSHISKPVLAEKMGYLQQEGRLFAGTLRDNLILGIMDPGDQSILAAARLTGLLDSVITSHPEGLQQKIHEGGTGLSGGQRQLVNLTRAFLRKPKIWLLDEPTASMDRNIEAQVIAAFTQVLDQSQTLVLVTHKPELLALVDRIIVIANHQVVMDGDKKNVLDKLSTPAKSTGVGQTA
jgi:ATP-binding cassette subfamily C protein LapB